MQRVIGKKADREDQTYPKQIENEHSKEHCPLSL
ncbi:hypothetical protein J2852_002072 [Azospirillum soli]|nr:hypothetical protein [Azospirillum soli]